MNTSAAELANTTRDERFMSKECKELLSIVTRMEVSIGIDLIP